MGQTPPQEIAWPTPLCGVQQGWAVAPGSIFLTGGVGEHHLGLCFGGLTVENTRRGVEALSDVIRQQLATEPHASVTTGEWMPLV
ncbi:MAG: hypothetical protein R6W76_18350 [Caldilinea sp.]